MKLTQSNHHFRNWEWNGMGCNEDKLDADVTANGVDGSKMADYLRTPDGKRVIDSEKDFIKWYDAI